MDSAAGRGSLLVGLGFLRGLGFVSGGAMQLRYARLRPLLCDRRVHVQVCSVWPQGIRSISMEQLGTILAGGVGGVTFFVIWLYAIIRWLSSGGGWWQ